MLIYLAAQYRRREELCGYRAALEAAGHIITSRWLNGTHEVEDNGIDPRAHHAATIRFAQEDTMDLARAELVIAFTEPPRRTASRGGRHVELGMALAWRKHVDIVGPREHVFCHLPEVRQWDTWEACRAALAQQEAV